ncbi:MAG: hypothetical protein V4722_21590 [Bacteroidota bacterium]
MAKKLILTAILSIGLLHMSMADIITEGQIARQFVINNLAKYKGFSFTYKYYTYHYHQGYHADTPTIKECLQNERYTAGTRFDKTKLEAKDTKGNLYESDVFIGGDTRVTNRNIQSVVDVYAVESVKNGVIKLKKQHEIIVYADGKEKKRKAELGAFITDDGDNMKPWLIGGAIAALAGLLFVFLKNKNNRFQIPYKPTPSLN